MKRASDSRRRRFGPIIGLGLFIASAVTLVAISEREAQADDAPPASIKALDAQALARFIDAEVGRRLTAEKVTPGPRSDDSEFLRRVYLDLVGVIPPPEKVQAFLDSKDAHKRSAVIEELLADPRFGKNLGETWTNLLIQRDSNNRRLGVAGLTTWLAAGFNENKSLDKLVYDLLTATGKIDENGAATFFIANPSVDKVTDTVSRMFLGVQLQCAQCHNHPFTDYKQTEYWGVAAFFTKTRIQGNAKGAVKKDAVPPSIVEGGGKGGGKGAGKGLTVPADAKRVPPKFLHGEQPKIADGQPYRPVLAHWLTSAENPFFAKAMANRFWYQFFGRGLVSPVDDMHADNTPSNPQLLTALADQLRANRFDTKYLVRAICNSETYQRSSRSKSADPADPDLYAQRVVRVLSPNQLFDSLTSVVGRGEGRRFPNIEKKGVVINQRDLFVNFFSVDDPNPLDYQAGIPQVLRMLNSPIVNNTGAAVTRLTKDTTTPATAIEALFLATYSRRPSPEETQRFTEFVARQPDPRTGYGDVLWALLNSSEFTLNH